MAVNGNHLSIAAWLPSGDGQRSDEVDPTGVRCERRTIAVFGHELARKVCFLFDSSR